MTRLRKAPSPRGRTVDADRAEHLAGSDKFRQIHAELAAFERLARAVILRRADLGISQRDLALRMGTSASVISRIESGQHPTSVRTLKRLAVALDGAAVVGFRFEGDKQQISDSLVEL